MFKGLLGAANVEIRGDLRPLRRDLQTARRETSTATNDMSAGFDRVDRSILPINGRALAAGAAIGVMGKAITDIVRNGDQLRALQGRFEALTGSVERGRNIFEGTLRTMQATGASIDTVAQATTRLTIIADDLGRSDAQVEQFVKNILDLGRLGGSDMASLNAATVQLVQGLGAGALRGDELNSVLENVPLVAQAIADRLGVSIGQLKEMGAEGRIVSDEVFQAIIDKTVEIERQIGELPPTVSVVAGQLAASWAIFTASIDDSIGASRTLVSVLQNAVRLLNTVNNLQTQNARNAFQLEQGALRSSAGVDADFAGPLLTAEQAEQVSRAGLLRPAPGTRTAPRPIGGNYEGEAEQRRQFAAGMGNSATGLRTAPLYSNKPPGNRPMDIAFQNPPRSGGGRRGGGGGARRLQSTSAIDAINSRLEERLALLGNEQQLIGTEGRARAELEAAFARERVERELLAAAQREGQKVTPLLAQQARDHAIEIERVTLAIYDENEALENIKDSAEDAAKAQERLAQQLGQVGQKLVQAAGNANSFEDALKNIGLVLLEVAANAAFGQGPLGGVFNDLIGVGSNGLLGLVGGGGSSFSVSGASSSALTGPAPTFRFSKGAIFDRPISFPMRGGATGQVAEAGMEAAMPIIRGPGGKLGVISHGGGKGDVYVNQTNHNTGIGVSKEDLATALDENTRKLSDTLRIQQMSGY